MILLCMVKSTGEWLEDRSKPATACVLCAGIPFVMLKSRKSGIFLLSRRWASMSVHPWRRALILLLHGFQ